MFFSKIQELEYRITNGKFKQALIFLNSIEKERSLSDDEVLIKKYVQSFICLDEGKLQKGKEFAKELIKEAQEKYNNLRELDGIIANIENSLSLTLYNECFDLLSQGELLLNYMHYIPITQFKHREAYLLFLKGKIYQETHRAYDGLECFRKSYIIRRDLGDKYGMLWSLFNWGILTVAIGDFKKSEERFKEGLNIAENLNLKVGIIWIFIMLGWNKYHLRDLETAMEYANRSLPICKKNDYKFPLAVCYDLVGHCNLIKGHLKEALSFFDKSLQIRINLGHKSLIAQSYYSIGSVYYQKGELRRSLKYYIKGLNVPIVEVRAMFKPAYLSIIGKIYGELGDYSKAKKYLSEALDSFIEKKIFVYHFHNFSLSIAKTFHYLIDLSIQNNSIEKLDEYLENLHEISRKNPEIKQIEQLYRLDKGIILNLNTRLKDKMKAGIIFKEISEEDIIDHEISVEAMVNLCDVLILELELTGDNRILQEIEMLSDKLLKIAQSQYLYNLLAETFFLKSKISLIKLNIDKARKLLTKAQKIANDRNLKLLANKISHEHDSLLEDLEEWEEIIKKNVPLQERINYSKHEFLFSKMIRSKIGYIPKEADKPIYLVILSIIDGHCLYSRAFENIGLNDGNLIAGFISAINIFGKEAFSSSGSIDRIKHGEYLIIFQSQDDFLFGYVFKGQSYSASSKLEIFVKNLSKSVNMIKELLFSVKNYTEISNRSRLIIDQLCIQIFKKDFVETKDQFLNKK